MTETKLPNSTSITPEAQLRLERLYVKEASFIIHHTPAVFEEQTQPEVLYHFDSDYTALANHQYEVVLTLQATVSHEQKSLMEITVRQAGLFTIQGMDSQELTGILKGYCLNRLLPYVAETASSLAVKGSFAPLLIAPLDFSVIYQQQRLKQQQEAQKAAETIAH